MLFFVKATHRIFTLLNSETSPAQLAAGLSLGMIVGLTPTWNLHNLVLFLIVCLFRVNFSMFFLGFGAFSLMSWMLGSLWDAFGYWLLVDFKSARPLWIKFASTPLVPYFRLNNTVVIGTLVAGLIMALPVYFAFVRFVKVYRERWREKVQSSKVVVLFRASKFYSIYDNYQKTKQKLGLV